MTVTPAESVSTGRPKVYGADAVVKATGDNQEYNASGAIPINTVILTADFSAFGAACIQCTQMGTSGVVTPEISNDGATWVAATLLTPVGATATTFSAAGMWVVPPIAHFLRLRMSTAASAGNTRIVLFQSADSLQYWLATQPSSLIGGTALVGDVGIGYRANAANAASFASCMSPATPAVGTIKASAGRLLSICLQNSSAALRSVKFFNATAPTLGTTAAAFEVDVPAGGFVNWQLEGGLAFATAITFSVTSAKGLTDSTAAGLAVNDVSGFFSFA